MENVCTHFLASKSGNGETLLVLQGSKRQALLTFVASGLSVYLYCCLNRHCWGERVNPVWIQNNKSSSMKRSRTLRWILVNTSQCLHTEPRALGTGPRFFSDSVINANSLEIITTKHWNPTLLTAVQLEMSPGMRSVKYKCKIFICSAVVEYKLWGDTIVKWWLYSEIQVLL